MTSIEKCFKDWMKNNNFNSPVFSENNMKSFAGYFFDSYMAENYYPDKVSVDQVNSNGYLLTVSDEFLETRIKNLETAINRNISSSYELREKLNAANKVLADRKSNIKFKVGDKVRWYSTTISDAICNTCAILAIVGDEYWLRSDKNIGVFKEPDQIVNYEQLKKHFIKIEQ